MGVSAENMTKKANVCGVMTSGNSLYVTKCGMSDDHRMLYTLMPHDPVHFWHGMIRNVVAQEARKAQCVQVYGDTNVTSTIMTVGETDTTYTAAAYTVAKQASLTSTATRDALMPFIFGMTLDSEKGAEGLS